MLHLIQSMSVLPGRQAGVNLCVCYIIDTCVVLFVEQPILLSIRANSKVVVTL
jgi:hypothetical protein